MLDGGLDGIESATPAGTGYSQSSISSAESPRRGPSGGPARFAARR